MHSYENKDFSSIKIVTGLNPCFNGRCTRTSDVNGQKVEKSVVLILVLMEDALVQG